MESSQRKDFGILMRLRCWIGEDFKSEIASERHRPHSLGSRRCQEGAPWNFWSRSHPGKSGRGGQVGSKEWKWGGNMRPWSDYYRRFGDPLGPERSTGAFKELMKTSFGTFPSWWSPSAINTFQLRLQSGGAGSLLVQGLLSRRMLCMSHVLKSFVRLFFLGKTEGDCGEVVSRVGQRGHQIIWIRARRRRSGGEG